MVRKARVTLGGVPLSGKNPSSWAFITGTDPHRATFQVRNKDWPKIQRMFSRNGENAQTLVISDRSRTIKIRGLFVLHESPSDSPHRHSFEVADKRIWWQYPLVSRDYNLARKTGSRSFTANQPGKDQIATPSQGALSADEYDYRRYTIKADESRWTAQEAVWDVMNQLEPAEGAFVIESFPITGGGQFALQNVMLHDNGDVALGRLLGFIPGTQVFINSEGVAVVYDAADLNATERHFKGLPITTYDGDFPEVIQRKAIRPRSVKVMYQREVEAVFEYRDSYITTVGGIAKDAPYVENVIPLTDPVTVMDWLDPSTGKLVNNERLPAGTWVEVSVWLDAMDALKGADSFPWTFKQASFDWMSGELDGNWGGKSDVDNSIQGEVQARINAFKTHFRTTYRISRRYMDRIQDIAAVRAAIINPLNGDPQPAAAWGQIAIIPTKKGENISKRYDDKRTGIITNIDTLPDHGENSGRLIGNPTLPLNVSMVDPDLGIFRIEFERSTYGTDSGFIPSHLEFGAKVGTPASAGRNLKLQHPGPNNQPMMHGVVPHHGTNGQVLAGATEFKFMLSIVPGAPNNKSRYHTETITADDIHPFYRGEYRIQGGEGPPLEVYVDPGEMAARFGWQNDTEARATLIRLLGLNSDDPNTAGLGGDDPKTKDVDESAMNGYMLTNDGDQLTGRHLRGHATAVAAEVYASFADSLQGTVKTRLPRNGVKVAGNMSGAAIEVAAYPSAEVSVTHEFPGQQEPISRMGLFPEPVRRLVLGILPFRKGGK